MDDQSRSFLSATTDHQILFHSDAFLNPTKPRSRWRFLSKTISAQLLLLRVIILIGPQGFARDSASEDGYKCTWSLRLYHQETGSTLEFYDSKGAPGIKFNGTKQGSKQALKLLGCLTSVDMLHPYDWTKAGDIA
jgi:hypothetical protein